MSRIRRQPARPANGIAKLLTGMAVMLIVVAFIDLRIRPVVEDIIAYQAQMAAFRTINAAMLRELDDSGTAYDDIVRLTRGEQGSVVSVQTDVVAVNRIKSRVAETVAAEFQNPENQAVKIPLGTLVGGNLVSGRGPEIEIRLIPAGYVQSQLYNQFTSAGINQTLHQIMLETTVQLVAVLPGYSVRTETSTSFCIAETVIVGEIPDGYTIVGEDGRSSISKAFDYQADHGGQSAGG